MFRVGVWEARFTLNEKGRRWVTVPGIITSHRIIDKRWGFTKWLETLFSPMMINFLNLCDNVHYMVTVHIDNDSYVEARDKLKVFNFNGNSTTLWNDTSFEVTKEDLDSVYTIGKRVAVSYGISPALDQFFTGAKPVCWEIKPIDSKEEFRKMPGAILSVKASLAFT